MAEYSLRRLSFVTIVSLALLGTAFAFRTSQPLWKVAILILAMGIGQLVRVPAPGGSHLYVGVAVAAAAPLLLREVFALGTAYAFGLLTSWVVLRLTKEDGLAIRRFFLAQVMALMAYAAVFLLIVEFFLSAGLEGQTADLVAVTGGAIAWFAVGAAVRALVAYEQQRLSLRYLWLLALAEWPVVLSLFASGGLFAFAVPVIGWWSLPVAVLPYAFSHVAFVRYGGTRVTYGQTIRALARIPEVAGLSPEGHSARTADLAIAIAQDVGMHPEDVIELEYAALMHDIGRITLNEPAILKAGYTDEDIARWGCQIIAEAPNLGRVSQLVLQQHEPYRRPGEETDESLPLGSKIIRIASAYDQAVRETRLPPIEALEVLHRGAAYDFDPRVVRSLRRVVSGRGAIAH